MGAEESKSFRPQETRVKTGVSPNAYQNEIKIEDTRKPVDVAAERIQANGEARRRTDHEKRRKRPRDDTRERDRKHNSSRKENAKNQRTSENKKEDLRSSKPSTKSDSRNRNTSPERRGSPKSDTIVENNKREKRKSNRDRKSRKSEKSKRHRTRGNRHTKNAVDEEISPRSEPNLTSVQDSRVGAWLNSAYNFPPEHEYFPHPGFYGSLPRDLGVMHHGPRELVDGMGYPVGRLHPISFAPNPEGYPQAFYPGFSPVFDPYSPPMGNYVTLPYPYMYNHPYYPENGGKKGRSRRKTSPGRHRSKSYNALEEMQDEWNYPDHVATRHKKKRSHSVDKSTHSVPAASSGQFFNDIDATQTSMAVNDVYRANQAISVDDVIVAEKTITSQDFEPEADDDDSSLTSSDSDSSINDVIMDENPTVQLFRPISGREVYIDNDPPEVTTDQNHDEAQTGHDMADERYDLTKIQSYDTDEHELQPETAPKDRNNNAPIMTLCESESIVATSFLTNQGKVFCLRRTRNEPSVIQGNPPSAERHNLEQPKEPISPNEPVTGVWFGLTGSPPAIRAIQHTSQKTGKENANIFVARTPTAHITPHVQEYLPEISYQATNEPARNNMVLNKPVTNNIVTDQPARNNMVTNEPSKNYMVINEPARNNNQPVRNNLATNEPPRSNMVTNQPARNNNQPVRNNIVTNQPEIATVAINQTAVSYTEPKQPDKPHPTTNKPEKLVISHEIAVQQPSPKVRSSNQQFLEPNLPFKPKETLTNRPKYQFVPKPYQQNKSKPIVTPKPPTAPKQTSTNTRAGFYSLFPKPNQETKATGPVNEATNNQIPAPVKITTSLSDLNEGRLFPSRSAGTVQSASFDDVIRANDATLKCDVTGVNEVTTKVDVSQTEPSGNDVSASSLRARVESLVNQYCDSSESSSEEDERYGSSGLGNRLLRIDSKDSINMKRRMKRRTSSHGSFSGFERRATIGSISQSDLRDAASMQSPAENPFRAPASPDLLPLLQRARSEEVLKKDLRKSQDVFQFPAVTKKKETLQERAARILGLSMDYLKDAKKSKTKPTGPPEQEESVFSNETSLTTVTSMEDKPSSESFAISVTNSMLEDNLNKYMVRDMQHDGQSFFTDDVTNVDDVTLPNDDVTRRSNSSDDVSTISRDSVENLSGASTVEEDDFSISSGSLVALHRSSEVPSRAPTEYKIPEDLFNESPPTPRKTLGQDGIVASYTKSIYDQSPTYRHARDFSDETTEDESAEHVAGTSDNFGKSQITRNYAQRVVESPVPIASNSAPLTSGELDIIMQLYSSADETASNVSNDYDVRRGKLNHDVTKRMNDVEKLNRVARAIGYDMDNVNRKDKNQANMEKVEDFEIKVFQRKDNRKQAAETLPSNSSDNKHEKQNDVIQAMQSLGINPDESWLVSL